MKKVYVDPTVKVIEVEEKYNILQGSNEELRYSPRSSNRWAEDEEEVL